MTMPAMRMQPGAPTVRAAAAPAPTAPTPQTISALPTELDLNIYAGDSCTIQFTFTHPNGTGADMTGTWSAQIRQQPGAPDPPLASFDIDTSQATIGIITIVLSSESSEALPVEPTCVWDLQISTTNAVTTTHRGIVSVTEDVTRP
jgi:hypothetical protein